MLVRVMGFLLATVVAFSGGVTSAHAVPSEPAYEAINVRASWNKGILGQGVTIAMIDQGVNLQHEYFQGQVIDGICVFQNTSTARCPNGLRSQIGLAAASQRRDIFGRLLVNESHGNMVAGIVAGRPNSVAPGGIAPEAKILMANTDMQPRSVVEVLEYIYQKRVEYNIVAVSMSFGVLGLTSRADLLNCNTNPAYADVRRSLKKLRDVGIIPFAAAGNGFYLNSVESWAPTCLDEAVSVGSVDADGEISIYNTMSTKVELLAPDYAISATTYGYAQASGTSAAAPTAAASYALLRQQFPKHSAQTVLDAMKISGRKIDDVVRKQIPLIDLAAAQTLLEKTPIDSNLLDLDLVTNQRVTVGTFNGFVAIYAQGFEGSQLVARIAGKWISVSPLKNVAGKQYALIKRNTGAGYDVRVEVWIDGVKQNLIAAGQDTGQVLVVRTR